MNRAAVWLCWGLDYIAQAARSAQTVRSLGLDRILITDDECVDAANGTGDFSSVIVTEMVYRNYLEKSRLIDLVPGGYDTFLYLDADTRILGDVNLGFAKAERHGIAMAPAPNYNLCTFNVEGTLIGDVMPRLGLEPADQINFNTGVIFFSLTPEVRQLFEHWRILCRDFAAPSGLPNDQPFLTLAMEQLGFVPYVLSPAYNYRGRGEQAVGSIRIWHSLYPPPPDLNVYATAWPPRRYIRGQRVSDEDPRG